MIPIISLLANRNGSFLINVQRLYSTLVCIPHNFTTVVHVGRDKVECYDYNARLIKTLRFIDIIF